MLDRVGQALGRGDAEALAAEMVDDVTLRVAVHDAPFEGVEATSGILGVVLGTVLRDIDVRDTIGDDDHGALLFGAKVVGYPRVADGLLVVRAGADGRIAELTVFLRPLAALHAVDEAMGRLMGGPRPEPID